MGNTKIIIIGTKYHTEISERLSFYDDSLNVCHWFSTSKEHQEYKYPNKEYVYYMDANTMNLSYKNNSLLCVNTQNYYSTGITYDDFYNSSIIHLTIKDFNNLPNKLFDLHENFLFIWIDNSKPDNKIEQYEYNYFTERLLQHTYMYFLNESTQDICQEILKYLKCESEEEKREILEKNS